MIVSVWHCCNVFFDNLFLGGGVGGGSWGGSWHGAEDRPKGPNKADQTGTSGRKIIDIQIQICRIKHIWFSVLFSLFINSLDQIKLFVSESLAPLTQHANGYKEPTIQFSEL